jgi:predicted HTH domain antitoxin
MGTLTIEYPEEILVSLKESKDEFSKELKIAAAAKLYELGKLSSGKAAKLAGMDKVSFLKILGEYQISISTLDEFEEDMKIAID